VRGRAAVPLKHAGHKQSECRSTRFYAVRDPVDRGRYRDAGGVAVSPNLLWIIAVIVAIIGIIVLISGSIVWGIVLLIAAALIGPGGYSIFRGRVR
jgi:hypothetical protein